MSNETKQTAVEWLIERLLDLDNEYGKGLITLGVWSERKNFLIQQAKEREEAQIINAYTQGQYDGDNIREGDAYEYYNLTYGGGEQ